MFYILFIDLKKLLLSYNINAGDSEKNKCRIMHKFNIGSSVGNGIRSSRELDLGSELKAEHSIKGSTSQPRCITTALCVALKLHSMHAFI